MFYPMIRVAIRPVLGGTVGLSQLNYGMSGVFAQSCSTAPRVCQS